MSDDDTTPSGTAVHEHETDHDKLIRMEGTLRNHGKQLNKIQGDIRWGVKIILTAVILAVLSLILVKQSSMQNPNQTQSHSGNPVSGQPIALPSSALASG